MSTLMSYWAETLRALLFVSDVNANVGPHNIGDLINLADLSALIVFNFKPPCGSAPRRASLPAIS